MHTITAWAVMMQVWTSELSHLLKYVSVSAKSGSDGDKLFQSYGAHALQRSCNAQRWQLWFPELVDHHVQVMATSNSQFMKVCTWEQSDVGT